jgi:hypothetical protein
LRVVLLFRNFVVEIINFLNSMLERMTQELKKLYSNLGLPESVLTSVASVAIMGMSEDSDDAALSARAGDEVISGMLKSFQSHADKVRTQARKAADDKNKEELSGDVPSWFKDYVVHQEKAQSDLLAKITALEGAATIKDFNSMVVRIGKELGLSDSMLDLCRGGLSSDMEENAVRDKLGSFKKTLIENGVKFEERLSSQATASRTQAELEEARAWAKENSLKSN